MNCIRTKVSRSTYKNGLTETVKLAAAPISTLFLYTETIPLDDACFVNSLYFRIPAEHRSLFDTFVTST